MRSTRTHLRSRLPGQAYKFAPGLHAIDNSVEKVPTFDTGKMSATGILATTARDREGDVLEVAGSRQVLGVVSKGYTPIQNKDCFNFLDQVVTDDGLRYHTAGALGKGERVWLLAKLPTSIHVRGSEDEVQQYLLLSNSHDGSSALRCFFTPIRVVCANTWNLAHRQHHGEGISIRHRGDLTARPHYTPPKWRY